MSTYGLKYYAEVQNFRKQLTRVEILQRDLPSGTTPLQIGDVCGLALEIQGAQEDIFTPIVKTQARLSMISSEDKPTAGGIKYGGWGEFFTPDDTLYKVVIKTKATPTTSSWTTRWSGYITPDSWSEGLEYRSAVTITARDNIGHLQDFEFDMPGDTYGLVRIKDFIDAAMEKVSMPMTLSYTQAPGYLEADGEKLINARFVAKHFYGRDWYTVLEGVLDSIGYTLRYTDNDRVTVAPLRHLPLTGESSHQAQPTIPDLEFYGGEGEQVPAVKKITDEHDYDYAGEVFLPIVGEFTYGNTQDYHAIIQRFPRVAGETNVNDMEHANYNKLSGLGGTAWLSGSDMLNVGLYVSGQNVNKDEYAFLAANGIDDDLRAQSLQFYTGTSDLTIRAVFASKPVCIHNSSGTMVLREMSASLFRACYTIAYQKGGATRYWNGYYWDTTETELKSEFESTEDVYPTDLEIALQPCTELGEGGVITFSFKGIWYKAWNGDELDWTLKGIYARLAGFSIAPNINNLSRNTVNTINDEKYNILLSRDPMLSPLSTDAPFAVPENYGTALFYYPNNGSDPAAFPYMMNWNTVSGNVTKPLPVFIHQQLLCYRGANLWELSGDCAPNGNAMMQFNGLCEYKNRTYILMSGTLDLLRGTVDGAVLREFLEYDDLWDDTEQPSPGEPGSWNSNPSYPGGGTPGSSPAGSSSAGGGGINIAVSEALQSFQSQIDAVSARDMFDELTATVVSSDVLTATEAYMGYAHASRYYLTDSIYFWAESVNGVMCVRLNAPLITAGDQIVISGTPGGGGGGGASYLDELLDVTITLPSNGQTLFYQDGIWVNGNIDFSNYYTKAQVDDIIGTIQQFHYEVYASLEDVTDPQNNVLYLIGPTGSGEDKYEEYVYSGGWVKIGDTSIDLSGYVQTARLDADEAIIAEAIQSLQSQIDAVSARDNYDELTASSLYADMLSATYAYAERYYLTDGVFFYIETVNGIPCVKLNAPFITDGDQVIISGTPGGGGGGGITLYDYDQVKAMTADVALTAPSAWAMHQMWAEIFGGASSVLTSDNYTNYVNTTNFPGLNKVGTVTSIATGTGLTGGPITASGTISIDPTYLGYINHGETAYGWGDILTQAIQSLQSQVDSVSARNNFDELTATVLFADTLSATSAYIGNITGHLSGNADTASHLISSSYAVGSATQPVYFSGGLPVSCTYSINAATTSGTAGRLAYYAGTNAISDFYNTIGGAYQPMYLNAGVPTACTYTLNAALFASSTAGRLAYYSGTNAVSEYYGNIGSGVIPMYLNAGVPTASTSTVGSASLPVYLNAGTITACTAASLFSALGSNIVNNLEVTVAGQLRTITNLYATYDGAGEVISDKFTIVSFAIQSLQSQIDSVATRFGTDECTATTAYFDMLSVGAYIYAGALVTTGDQTVASDATLKKNWRGLNYGIEDIANATAGVFDWKDGHGTSAGTIAQEWKALIPELVHGEEGGMSLAYGQAAMLNTILLARHETEQDREIRQLKARVDELETRLKIRS